MVLLKYHYSFTKVDISFLQNHAFKMMQYVMFLRKVERNGVTVYVIVDEIEALLTGICNSTTTIITRTFLRLYAICCFVNTCHDMQRISALFSYLIIVEY